MAVSAEKITRRATHEDLDHVVRLGTDFHAYSPWKNDPLDHEAFRAFLGSMIENGAVFLCGESMIVGALVPMWFNPAIVIAFEVGWWAPDGNGRAVREAFEAWAKANGAQGAQCAALSDHQIHRVTKIYERAGYSPSEAAFLKRF